LVRVFSLYQRHCDSQARLLVVGDGGGAGVYAAQVRDLAAALGARDVVLTGKVRDETLLALYQVSRVFLCLSDHEGFCAPLVEAMRFGVPVLATDAGAVGETLGEAGVLIREKDYEAVGEMLDAMARDGAFRERLIDQGRRRGERFRYERVSLEWREALERIGGLTR
jgi:glycosyltransferase involved in cell wall biosynthesis